MSSDQKWAVLMDGRVLYAGLDRPEAERQATMLAEGFDRHKCNDKKRTGEFTIKPDRRDVAQHNQLYRALKTHTTVSLAS